LYALHERLRVPESKNELSLAVPFLDLNGFDAESSAIMSKPSRSPARSLCDYGQKNKTTLKLCDRLIDDPHSLRRFLSAKQAELYQTVTVSSAQPSSLATSVLRSCVSAPFVAKRLQKWNQRSTRN